MGAQGKIDAAAGVPPSSNGGTWLIGMKKMASEEQENRAPGARGGEKPSLEEIFLAGSTREDPEFDQELLELTRERSRGSVLRPILMLVVILFIGSVINDWSDELAYFFGSAEPLEMGEVTEFPVLGQDPEWQPPVEHNRYVSVEGLPTRISRGGEYEFFRLIGGEFYVQRKLSEEEQARAERALPSRSEMMGMSPGGDRNRYVGRGRLMAFSQAPQRFEGLKRHYGERYGTRFCEDYTPRQLQELDRQRREQAAINWVNRYENASLEERQRRALTPAPTEADLDDLLERNPVCVHAYMIYDGQSPRDLWWYVLLSALLGALMLFNVVKLVRWFRNWVRP